MSLISVLISCTRAYLPYLEKSLSTIPNTSNIEIIIVVDYGLKKEVGKFLNFQNLKIIELNSPMENMKKAYCLNLAAKNAASPYLFLADADFLYPKILWFYLFENMPNKKEVYHFFLGRINKSITEKIFAGVISWEDIYEKYEGMYILSSPSFSQKLIIKFSNYLCSFVGLKSSFYIDKPIYEEIFGNINPCVYSKDFFMELGGYDENFVGWGGRMTI